MKWYAIIEWNEVTVEILLLIHMIDSRLGVYKKNRTLQWFNISHKSYH